MKHILITLLTLASVTALAQRGERMGGVAGGGMPGFEYLNCQGEIFTSKKKLEEVSIRVYVTRLGMMTKIMRLEDAKIIVLEKTQRNTDHFGISYVGEKATLEIPQIPSPTWGEGEVETIVKIAGIRQSTILCNAFKP